MEACGGIVGAGNFQFGLADANPFKRSSLRSSSGSRGIDPLKPWFQAMLVMIRSAESF